MEPMNKECRISNVVTGSITAKFLIVIREVEIIHFVPSCSTPIIVPCVALLYDINTDEHMRSC